jgi:hypothetical protein
MEPLSQWIENITIFGVSPNATMLNVPWAFPAAETFHFMGLTLLLGSLIVVDVRGLGLLRIIPFEAAHKLIILAIIGFGLNLATGIAFLLADPRSYFANDGFWYKMTFILLAGLNAIAFEYFVSRRKAPGYNVILAGAAVFLLAFIAIMVPFYAKQTPASVIALVVAGLGALAVAYGSVRLLLAAAKANAAGYRVVLIGAGVAAAAFLISGVIPPSWYAYGWVFALVGVVGFVAAMYGFVRLVFFADIGGHATAEGAVAAKVTSALSLVFWFCVLMLGRFLPYTEF